MAPGLPHHPDHRSCPTSHSRRTTSRPLTIAWALTFDSSRRRRGRPQPGRWRRSGCAAPAGWNRRPRRSLRDPWGGGSVSAARLPGGAAAQIAPIGNGQSQIVDAAAEGIFEFTHGALLNESDRVRRCASPCLRSVVTQARGFVNSIDNPRPQGFGAWVLPLTGIRPCTSCALQNQAAASTPCLAPSCIGWDRYTISSVLR
jgi:hypothetical protein